MYLDTNLGENTRHGEVFDEQAETYVFPGVQSTGGNAGTGSRIHELFVESRSSAGSRSIMGMMREEGTAIGRIKVTRLMEELGLVCKQCL